MQEFEDLVNRPRVSNRAKAHMITVQEQEDFLNRQLTNDDDYLIDDLTNDDVLVILREKGADLRRGDFIFIGSDIGYRNDGKRMFNGRQVIDLSRETDV